MVSWVDLIFCSFEKKGGVILFEVELLGKSRCFLYYINDANRSSRGLISEPLIRRFQRISLPHP